MLRTLTTAAILSLTVASAQAEDSSLDTRIHDAAVKFCAATFNQSLPLSYYGVLNRACIDKVSHDTKKKYQAEAEAKAKASTVAFGNN